ncbi:hypothetical protein EJ07DRAFT_163018 [Lizonia empirigonia]|nr:hypothetical protein EJ07DRAFT_163018 [Lizonia empirigonia]
MSSKESDKAFQRHPRPQAPALDNRVSLSRFSVPTKAALLERSLRKKNEMSTDPWKTLLLQGDLIQGRTRWHLCIHEGVMALLRSTDIHSGKRELEKIKTLSSHPHIATINQIFESEGLMYFRFDYSRFTLEEILNFFQANFENCTWTTADITSNIDLASLGSCVLECMNGKPSEDLRNPAQIRRKRESNKMFGLSNGESWSGHKLLVDFLETLFNDSAPSIIKLEKPHPYVTPQPGYCTLTPFLELASLECHALWRRAAVKQVGGTDDAIRE